MAIARAAPSTGSVPAPNSSNITKESQVTSFNIETVFVICDENVDKLCSILCSSPISANILSYTHILVPKSAGICRPLCVISANRPTVFIVTVLPPVFGPVMTNVSKSLPR